MARHRLTDDQWELITGIFPPPDRMGRPRVDRRMVVDGILWIMRTGAPWRDLPEEFGNWGTVYDLFTTWNQDGTLDEILDLLRPAHLEEAGFRQRADSTTVRTVERAAGAADSADNRSFGRQFAACGFVL